MSSSFGSADHVRGRRRERRLVLSALGESSGLVEGRWVALGIGNAGRANERIHDDEPDTSEPIVRAPLRAECSHLSESPIEYLKTSGTDNAMWRVRLDAEPDVVVRLPRRPLAAVGVEREMMVLTYTRVSGTLGVCWLGRVRVVPQG